MKKTNHINIIKLKILRKILFLDDIRKLSWISFLLEESDSSEVLIEQILKRGNVVWVDFGVNPGDEFSGLHPAIILQAYKNNRTVYIVPIDTGVCKSKDYCVNIPRVYGFKDRPRYVNVYRAQWLSTKRIDFNNRVGHIDNSVLKEIDIAMKKSKNCIDKT